MRTENICMKLKQKTIRRFEYEEREPIPIEDPSKLQATPNSRILQTPE